MIARRGRKWGFENVFLPVVVLLLLVEVMLDFKDKEEVDDDSYQGEKERQTGAHTLSINAIFSFLLASGVHLDLITRLWSPPCSDHTADQIRILIRKLLPSTQDMTIGQDGALATTDARLLLSSPLFRSQVGCVCDSIVRTCHFGLSQPVWWSPFDFYADCRLIEQIYEIFLLL